MTGSRAMDKPDGMPKVSIIIPVFNSESFLNETLSSVLGQTWKEKEIIIVDDGSTDNSIEIAETFVSEVVKLIRTTRGGAAKARNIGLRYASGSYIQYIDADDLMPPRKIEIQMNLLLANQEPSNCVVACRWIRFSENTGNLIGGVGPGGLAENDLSPADWLVLRPYNLQMLHGWLTPRKLIDAAGPWDESMTLDDDGEFFNRVVSKSKLVLFSRDTMVYYRTSLQGNTLSFYSKFSTGSENCSKLESSYRSAITYRNVLLPFRHPYGRKAVGLTFLHLAYSSYLFCDDVYRKCIGQPEIPWLQRFAIYKLVGGRFGFLSLIVGWRLSKRIASGFRIRKSTLG